MQTTQTPPLPTFAKHEILGSPRLESTYTARQPGALESLLSSSLAFPIGQPFLDEEARPLTRPHLATTYLFPIRGHPSHASQASSVSTEHYVCLPVWVSIHLSLPNTGFQNMVVLSRPPKTVVLPRTNPFLGVKGARSRAVPKRPTAARLPAYSSHSRVHPPLQVTPLSLHPQTKPSARAEPHIQSSRHLVFHRTKRNPRDPGTHAHPPHDSICQLLSQLRVHTPLWSSHSGLCTCILFNGSSLPPG
ncbi:hypothetical protein LY76DRAFT_117312 [Colletotrichum caudatum]|nr:hypothetical protein LY76DRAFT_117312 [Colletotrichum caudatum]